MSEYGEHKEICSGCGKLRVIKNQSYHLCRKCNEARIKGNLNGEKKLEVKNMEEKNIIEPEEVEWVRDSILRERDERIRREAREEAKPKTEEKEYACGNCGYEFNGKPKYCPNCGTELDFEGVE
jgi:rubrerythrin